VEALEKCHWDAHCKQHGVSRRSLSILYLVFHVVEGCNRGILDKIDEYRLNWHLHLPRMPQNRIPLE